MLPTRFCKTTLDSMHLQVWVTDLNESTTLKGELRLCVIKHIYDRSLAPWRPAPGRTADLVTTTVVMWVAWSLVEEHPIVHLDHGGRYPIRPSQLSQNRHRLRMTMGRISKSADNASADSVFGQPKQTLAHQCRFRNLEEALEKINRYVLNIYNPPRSSALLRYELERVDKKENGIRLSKA